MEGIMKQYNKNDDNISSQFHKVIGHIADALEDCKLMMVSVQNAIDHGTPAAQVIVFRDRMPKDGLCALKD
jgi:hypothetical protein